MRQQSYRGSRKRGRYVPAVRPTVSSHKEVNMSADLVSADVSAPGLASTPAKRDVKSRGRDENRSMSRFAYLSLTKYSLFKAKRA